MDPMGHGVKSLFQQILRWFKNVQEIKSWISHYDFLGDFVIL